MKRFLLCVSGITCISSATVTKKPALKEHSLPTKAVVHESLKPHGLEGISEEQIEQHWQLYKGYVAQVNQLHEDLLVLKNEGKQKSALYADRRRRYGFEYNGMVLHEYYFGNLKNDKKEPSPTLKQAIEKEFGSYNEWLDDFKESGKTRGIGWALLVMDPSTKELLNIFVADHELGTLTGFIPLLVMDVWEHAYMVDHKATERTAYIEAFVSNIHWEVVNKRYEEGLNGILTKRFE